MTDRKPLSLSLGDMKPRERGRAPADKKAVSDASSWSSREPSTETAQINIRGDKAIIERYKALCEANGRRTYLEMMEILMDRFEG